MTRYLLENAHYTAELLLHMEIARTLVLKEGIGRSIIDAIKRVSIFIVQNTPRSN